MEIGPVASDFAWSDFLVLRLFRRWAAARKLGDPVLPSLVDLAGQLGTGPQAAISVHSVFQLVESCLGRPLQAECCCSRQLAPDERAMLALIGTSPPDGTGTATSAIPHGLPGALWWAVKSARMALDYPLPFAAASHGRCPFERQADVVR